MTFLEQLKIICDKYDAHYGSYPESKYEGVLNGFKISWGSFRLDERTDS